MKRPAGSGHVINEEEETDSKSRPHKSSLTHFMVFSAFCLHCLTLSLLFAPPPVQLLTHLFTESGLQSLQGRHFLWMSTVVFPDSLSAVRSHSSGKQSKHITGVKLDGGGGAGLTSRITHVQTVF